jgi:hypothetical protein
MWPAGRTPLVADDLRAGAIESINTAFGRPAMHVERSHHPHRLVGEYAVVLCAEHLRVRAD